MLCLSRRKIPEINLHVNTIENALISREEEVTNEFDYLDEIDQELPNDFGYGKSFKDISIW